MLRKCRFTFVQIIVPGGRVGPQLGDQVLHRNIQLNIDISKFGGPRTNFEISGCSRYPKSKFFDSISVFVFVLTC